MWMITTQEKLLLEAYKAIGTPEHIIRRLEHPFPDAEDGYSPLPHVMKEDFQVCAGILEEDDDGQPVTTEYPGSTVVKQDYWNDRK